MQFNVQPQNFEQPSYPEHTNNAFVYLTRTPHKAMNYAQEISENYNPAFHNPKGKGTRQIPVLLRVPKTTTGDVECDPNFPAERDPHTCERLRTTARISPDNIDVADLVIDTMTFSPHPYKIGQWEPITTYDTTQTRAFTVLRPERINKQRIMYKPALTIFGKDDAIKRAEREIAEAKRRLHI